MGAPSSSSPIHKEREASGLGVQRQFERVGNSTSQLPAPSLFCPLPFPGYSTPQKGRAISLPCYCHFNIPHPSWMCLCFVLNVCVQHVARSPVCVNTCYCMCLSLTLHLSHSLTFHSPSITFCLCECACRVIQGVNYSGCLSGWNKNPAQTA